MQQAPVLLFDISGVLVELGGMPEFVRWSGMSEKQVGDSWLVCESARALESGRIGFSEFHTAFVDEWNIEITQDALREAFASWVSVAFDGAIDLLQELQPRYRLACLCNTNEVQWPVVRKTIQADRFFPMQFISHLMGRVKPDPVTFTHVVQALNTTPENIVYFDDSWRNVESAQAFQINAFQVSGVGEVRQVLASLGLL
ncbi:HAD-IA family hydrolase [Gilvimarinus sp. SDUM040013]|uniref:HAD-IA family hydrolase n=1 Tax=Gilvimarinus gilvus TaxID=3058038 RepID=A0ABU4RZV8_9GAMM|nr:HAD-IA family hydrolase [Gilvimarinus sp. SDUM040013]MDO3384742.1 HAD-IA family hydrolase [Gilvimarinus sp. SDUM040013]MDX6850440.1 HAD-IA family hydrolase [Gilvimarinus sp. SDUM040013]